MKPLKPSPALLSLAKKYVWWEPSGWALSHPEVFLSNVMNLGSWDDFVLLWNAVTLSKLKTAIKNAPPGYFHARSWDYWHHKLGLLPVPDLPKRKF